MTPSTQDARATGLVELAVRCEQATGADRELDREIELALPVYEDAKHLAFGIPAYTASLDAAMTLVPEGWTFWSIRFERIGTGNDGAVAEVSRLVGDEEERAAGYAATPALALTAAAIHALAASTKDMNHDG